MQLRRSGIYSLNNFPQEPAAPFKAATVSAFTRSRAKKLVPQIAVAMLYVHKIETQLPCYGGRAMKILYDGLDFSVRKHGVVARKIQPPVQNRMTIENPGFSPITSIWTAVTPGVRQLQPNQ